MELSDLANVSQLPFPSSPSKTACQALEALLKTIGGKPKRAKGSQLMRSIFNTNKMRQKDGTESPEDLSHVDSLEEVAALVKALASGEMRENPGVDSEVWQHAMEGILLSRDTRNI